eukprot:gene36707-45280_t
MSVKALSNFNTHFANFPATLQEEFEKSTVVFPVQDSENVNIATTYKNGLERLLSTPSATTTTTTLTSSDSLPNILDEARGAVTTRRGDVKPEVYTPFHSLEAYPYNPFVNSHDLDTFLTHEEQAAESAKLIKNPRTPADILKTSSVVKRNKTVKDPTKSVDLSLVERLALQEEKTTSERVKNFIDFSKQQQTTSATTFKIEDLSANVSAPKTVSAEPAVMSVESITGSLAQSDLVFVAPERSAVETIKIVEPAVLASTPQLTPLTSLESESVHTSAGFDPQSMRNNAQETQFADSEVKTKTSSKTTIKTQAAPAAPTEGLSAGQVETLRAQAREKEAHTYANNQWNLHYMKDHMKRHRAIKNNTALTAEQTLQQTNQLDIERRANIRALKREFEELHPETAVKTQAASTKSDIAAALLSADFHTTLSPVAVATATKSPIAA